MDREETFLAGQQDPLEGREAVDAGNRTKG